MSIINDALKKVEKAINYDYSLNPPKKTASPAPEPKIEINKYLVYALIFVFGLFIENTFFLYFFRPKVLSSKLFFSETRVEENASAGLLALQEPAMLKQELPVVSLPETTHGTPAQPALSAVPAGEEGESQKSALVLNGIFFSQESGYYALINNTIVKQGDTIEGALVKTIDLDNVELESKTGLLVRLSQER